MSLIITLPNLFSQANNLSLLVYVFNSNPISPGLFMASDTVPGLPSSGILPGFPVATLS